MNDSLMSPQGGLYQWRETPGWKFVGDADEIAQHIASLTERKGGFVTTDELVADALDERSPLHGNVELDDRVAAHNWRKHQMRNLVGALVRVSVVEADDGEKELRVRAFPSVISDGARSYTTVEMVLSEADLRRQYVLRLNQEIRIWQRKAAEFREFTDVVEVIGRLQLPAQTEENQQYGEK